MVHIYQGSKCGTPCSVILGNLKGAHGILLRGYCNHIELNNVLIEFIKRLIVIINRLIKFINRFIMPFDKLTELFNRLSEFIIRLITLSNVVIMLVVRLNDLILTLIFLWLCYFIFWLSKNQYDEEAATARNALQNYVYQGNNIQSADYIFITLTSTKLQSIKVSFIEFDKTIMLLKRKTVAGIDKYHFLLVHSTWYESMTVLSDRSRTCDTVWSISFFQTKSSSYSVLCPILRWFNIQHKKCKKKRSSDK